MNTRAIIISALALAALLATGCDALEPDPPAPAAGGSTAVTTREETPGDFASSVVANPGEYHFGALWLWEQDTVDWVLRNTGENDFSVTAYLQLISIWDYPDQGFFSIDGFNLTITHADGTPLEGSPPHLFQAEEAWRVRIVIVPEEVGPLKLPAPENRYDPFYIVRVWMVQWNGEEVGEVIFKDLHITGDAIAIPGDAAGIKAFYDWAVAGGGLVFGSPKEQLSFEKQLELAVRLGEGDNPAPSCAKLRWLLARCDGEPAPADLISGDLRGQLYDYIRHALETMDCPGPIL